MKETIFDLDALPSVAVRFAAEIGERRVFAFYGAMGAGKTTFVRALCKVFGVEDIVNSPTFSIVNEYTASHIVDTVYHFDFYRINRLEEVFDMGYEDYFFSGALCLIEWPELVESLLPSDTVRVRLEELSDGRRKMAVES